MTQTHAAAWGPGQGAGRWGHWAPQILIAAVLVTVVLAVAPMPLGNPLTPLLPVLLVAVVIATWLKMRRHDRGLCEFCVAAMPLNAPAAAQRYRRRLALAHLGGNRRALAAYLVVLLGADLSLAVVPPGLFPWAIGLWMGVQSTLIYLVLSHVTHRRLQPWCTQCEGGGEGRGELGAPDPVPFDSRTR